MAVQQTARAGFPATVAERDAEAVVLTVPGTDYRLHLGVPGGGLPEPGQRVQGRIAARAKKVATIQAGGRYVEPVFGRPRRVQGRVAAVDAAANTLLVQCGGPVVLATLTHPRQQASDFAPGQMVSFDVEPGATWRPAD